MGSFYSSCALSRLQIIDNDRMVAVLLQKQDSTDNSYTHSPCEYYNIASFALRGKYNDYGRIELDDTQENRISFAFMLKVILNNITQNEKSDLPTTFEEFEQLQNQLFEASVGSKLGKFSFTFFHEKLFDELIEGDFSQKNQNIQASWDNWEHILKTIWHHHAHTSQPDRFARLTQKPSAFLRLEHDIKFSKEELALLELRTQDVYYFINSSLSHSINDDLTTFAMMDYMDQVESKNNGDLYSFEGYEHYRKLAIQMHQFFDGIDFLNMILLPQATSGQEIRVMKENDWQMKILHFTQDKILSLKEDGFLSQEDTDNLKEKQLSTLESHYLENSIETNSSKKGIKL